MTILSAIEKADLSPAMAELVETSGSDSNRANALQIFAHKQEVFEPIWTAYVNMLENGKVDRDVKELIRIKIAQNNDCSAYVDKSSLRQIPRAALSVANLNEEKIAAVGSYEVSEIFSRREKLALKFAEKLGVEPEALDDDFFAQLREEFTDPEVVELGHIIAMGIGFERFLAVWEPRVCAI